MYSLNVRSCLSSDYFFSLTFVIRWRRRCFQTMLIVYSVSSRGPKPMVCALVSIDFSVRHYLIYFLVIDPRRKKKFFSKHPRSKHRIIYHRGFVFIPRRSGVICSIFLFFDRCTWGGGVLRYQTNISYATIWFLNSKSASVLIFFLFPDSSICVSVSV